MKLRVFKRCAEVSGKDNRDIHVDVGSIIENLLLFETYILNSIRLRELPLLIATFGYEGLRDLLKMGALKINVEALSVAQLGQTPLEGRLRKGLLPLGSYSFLLIRSENEKEYIHDCFKVVEEITGLKRKQSIKLKEIVAGNLVARTREDQKEILTQLKKDLGSNDPSLKLALAKVVKSEKEVVLDIDKLRLQIHYIDEEDFNVESNVMELLRVDESEAHKLIEKAIFAITRRNQRILDMKTFKALTSFRGDEVSLLESKLNYLVRQSTSDRPGESLRRLMDIKNFPDLQQAALEGKINIEKFLKILHSHELKEFRSWLWAITDASDKEIEEALSTFRQKIGGFIRAPKGIFLRWLTGFGSGFIPVAGPAISGAFGLMDSFLLEKVLPTKGAIVFLDTKMPSIFKEG